MRIRSCCCDCFHTTRTTPSSRNENNNQQKHRRYIHCKRCKETNHETDVKNKKSNKRSLIRPRSDRQHCADSFSVMTSISTNTSQRMLMVVLVITSCMHCCTSTRTEMIRCVSNRSYHQGIAFGVSMLIVQLLLFHPVAGQQPLRHTTGSSSSTSSQHQDENHILESTDKQQQQQQQYHSPIVTLKKISTMLYNTAPIALRNNNDNVNPSDRNEEQQHEVNDDEMDFLRWCSDVYNISTSLVHIQYFPYNKSTTFPFMRRNLPNHESIVHNDDDWNFDDDVNNNGNDDVDTGQHHQQQQNVQDSDIIWIRGLAASRNIHIGEILLRIPNQALFSVTTLIDTDPILSTIIGPEVRNKYGWKTSVTLNDDTGGSAIDHIYEIPLLSIALLYHRQLGAESPIYNYVKILIQSPIDHLPYTWNQQQQNQYQKQAFYNVESSVSFSNVLTIANEIRHEIKYMYKHVVRKLIVEHSTVFGNTTALDPTTKEWVYSYPMFQWAYAIVNSRHWQLPHDILSKTSNTMTNVTQQEHKQKTIPTMPLLDEGMDQQPPAETPTESWISEHDVGDVDASSRSSKNTEQTIDGNNYNDPIVNHSFLAPIADLLNFGFPCTRVRYNETTNTFDTVATCNIERGHEITFWYSNECSDIMMSLYGFAHPLITHCLTNEELQERNAMLETKLNHAHKNLKLLEEELEYLENILDTCDCCFNETALLIEEGDYDPTISTMALHEEDSRQVGNRLRQQHQDVDDRHQRHLDNIHNNNHPAAVGSPNPEGTTNGDAITNKYNAKKAADAATMTGHTPSSTNTEEERSSHLLIRRTDTSSSSKRSSRQRRRRRWSQTSEF